MTSATISLVARDTTRVDPLAIEQLRHSAALDGMARVVGLPDLHAGRGIAVGAAFWSRGVLHPPLVGSDIGCGMALWRSDMKLRRFRIDAAEKKLHGLEEAWDGDAAARLVAAGLPGDLHGEGALRIDFMLSARGLLAAAVDEHDETVIDRRCLHARAPVSDACSVLTASFVPG